MPSFAKTSIFRASASLGAASVGFGGALLLSASLAAALSVSSATAVSAQGLFGNWDDAPQRPRAAVKRSRPQKVNADKDDDDADGVKAPAQRPFSGPLLLSVSLGKQKVTVFDAHGVVAQSPISSGRVGYSTPMGVFTVVEKEKMHHSNLYSGAPMPNMQRITWSGVALHAGVLPGYPASHGCIRLPQGFSQKLYGMTKVGTRVIVSRDPLVPAPFVNDRLFAAYPPDGEVSAARASTQVADASNSTVGSGPDVPKVLGVTAAAAAETETGSTSTHMPLRSPYRVRRDAELGRIAGDMRTAGYRKVEMSIALAQAAKLAEEARKPLVAARAEVNKLEAAYRKAAAAEEAVKDEIADFDRRAAKRTGTTAHAEILLSDKRQALEDKLPQLAEASAAAKTVWQAGLGSIKPLEDAANEVDGKRRLALVELNKANADLIQANTEEQELKRRDAKRAYPVSVLISRSKQRLYVRQGWQQILDIPVTFERPDELVGTHVFTALDYNADKTGMQWSVVSIPSLGSAKGDQSKRKDKAAKIEAPQPAVPASQQTAAAALERVTIPEDAREQIADVMKPGSSLIVTDQGLSGETGEYTDFIVSLR